MSNEDEVPAPPPALVTRVGKPAPKVPKGTIPRRVATRHYALEHLKEIHLYLDEPADTAKKEVAGEPWSVEYVTSLKRRVRGRVKRNWFPAGKWEVTTEPWLTLENGRWTILVDERVATSLGYIKYKYLSRQGLGEALIETLRERERHTSLLSLDFDGEDGRTVRRLIEGTYGVPVTLEVSYAKMGGGSAESLEEISPLTDEHVDVLANEAVARLFLQFLEHFGEMPVDYQTAQGGLSREELEQLMDGHPGRGNDIERFANLFTQGYAEFQAAKGAAARPPVGLAEFKAMEEAIFYQRKAGNDLALRNQLEIAVGDHYYTTTEGKGAFNRDIGVLRRDSASGVLLYDRDGIAMRSLLGYWDSDYTSVSLGKVQRDDSIPLRSRELTDHNIKVLFQAFGLPAMEIHALVASLHRHFAFITAEVYERYNGEIGERIIAMMPWVVGFFVGHAMAGFLMTTGWGLAPGLLLLGGLKAAGWVMGFDFAFMVTQKATAAGREFVQMERLHRESGDKEPRLTALSQSHLEAGAKPLIDAIADVVSLGVVFVGGKVGSKVGPAVKKGLLKPPAEARLKLTVDANDTVIVVEPVKVEDQVGTGWLEELLQKGKEGDGAAADPPWADPDAQQLGETPETPASLGEPNVAPAPSQAASAGEGVGSATAEARNPEKGGGEPEEPRGISLEAQQPKGAAEAPPSPGGADAVPAQSQATPEGVVVGATATDVKSPEKGGGTTDKPPEAAQEAQQTESAPETPAPETDAVPRQSQSAPVNDDSGSAGTEAFEKKAAESWKDRSIEEDGPYVGKGMKGKVPETPVAPNAAEVGARLVGANRAIIDPRKLTEYALNPNHPVGGNKARVFERLGFNQGNAGDLMQQLRTGVMENTPTPGKVDQFGARFTVDIPVVGPQGAGIVRTGWIFKAGSKIPELTTLFVK